ncbi:MAG: cytochrome c oxidase assembly factor 1 family protein [Desulfobulbaceae bacterium]|nr:cytochrome c oxidase assembly factor 1 family protein [Desulfobulbaceae bacterium]
MTVISAFFPITLCVLATVLFVCFLVIRSSTIYKMSVAAVHENDKVTAQLGSPVQPGLLVMGNICSRSTGKMVNLSIPLSGPLGHATAFVVARRQDKKWKFTTLQVQCREAGAHIDLLET